MPHRETRTPALLAVALVVAPLLSSCNADRQQLGDGSVVASSEIRLEPELMERQAPDQRVLRAPDFLWTDTIDVILGQPRFVLLLGDTSIVVGDRQLQNISIYDATGTLLRQHGSPGPGPGEFQRLSGVVPVGDDRNADIIGVDGDGRWSRFDKTGALVGTGSLGGLPGVVTGAAGHLVSSSDLNAPRFRVFDGDLREVVQFGEPLYPFEEWMLGVGVTVGALSAPGEEQGSAERADFVHATMYTGLIVGYRLDGTTVFARRMIEAQRLSTIHAKSIEVDGQTHRTVDSESVRATTMAANADDEFVYVIVIADEFDAGESDGVYRFPIDVYDLTNGAYEYTIDHSSPGCAFRYIRGSLAIQGCADGRLVLSEMVLGRRGDGVRS